MGRHSEPNMRRVKPQLACFVTCRPSENEYTHGEDLKARSRDRARLAEDKGKAGVVRVVAVGEVRREGEVVRGVEHATAEAAARRRHGALGGGCGDHGRDGAEGESEEVEGEHGVSGEDGGGGEKDGRRNGEGKKRGRKKGPRGMRGTDQAGGDFKGEAA